ncbi:ATP-binding protein [Neorhizobium sp. NCHU2750]|uniref:ATP-binding protein n=1 Tax=Neorhizobium sp. NCHU2750 TaxID=1825976 RepID=UPI000E7196CA|nr:sensor protein [Neorhizobium sp. NCHU2750]
MSLTVSDLEACAREPIHIPGAIQPYGALLSLHPEDLSVAQASANLAGFIGEVVRPGERLPALLQPLSDRLAAWQATSEPTLQMRVAASDLQVTAHRSGGLIVVEVERNAADDTDGLLSRLRDFAQILSGQSDVEGSLTAAATFIENLTGFDRVLVYRFDRNWNGHVVAEAANGALPSYLDLRFPASDIPAQARALYASSRVRLIPDANYRPVPIEPALNPVTGEPLDLSLSQLRSVSPVHLEYMRNMGTASSMSVSIIIDGRLWGLVSCHSAAAKVVSNTLRDICDFVVQSLAMRVSALLHAVDAESRVALGRISSRLLASMSAGASWPRGLIQVEDDLLAQVRARGAVIVTEDDYLAVGMVPDEAHVRSLVDWLKENVSEDIYQTSSLARDFRAGEAFAAEASGMVAIRISELYPSWLIWFRPEVITTVNWGGDPHKVVREEGRIHPRRSFDAWREQVHLTAPEWSEAELSAARDLRGAIVGIVLRKAEELAELSGELQRSNKELEAFSYSVSHDLRAPFRHIVGFAQLLREREQALDEKSRHYLHNISDSALAAGRLVDDLLNFSQLGRTSIAIKEVDMNKLVAEVVKSVMINAEGRDIEWSIARLPSAQGDATLLRQVWFNLIDNAVKYTRPRAPAKIMIDGSLDGDIVKFSVSDNGVGFDMTYAGKLFGVFQRLQRAEDFEGTGIGLALVRRIVERHNGSITASGEVDKGATFVFALPTPERKGRAIA